ncbi:MAG: discoidin domain-containing protein [Candidatus Cohnella colombiensis]|uniref:Discoidin domain-containing protein n=1 Tax=Candidatus Cohnella colombiensis TaxID=3121368 RepID=A0AA95EZT3_9BACL|nr:MAG: discoidin domain-containing protein [Cohnella sp.]
MLRRTLSTISVLAIVISLCSVQPKVSNAATPISQANATIFGPNVYIFDPTMATSDIQNVANTIFNSQETNQFGNERYAMLFKPGSYNVNLKEGFFTSVAGLGQNPDEVNITGGFNVDAKWANGNATQNFWRSIENIKITPSSGKTQWAVSQAAPMRRVHIAGSMDLFDFDTSWNAGWASGGYLADSKVDSKIVPASQQQWFSRNSQYTQWSNGVWNMVFVGDTNPPTGNFPNPPYTVVDQTPVVREKPYLYVDSSNNYRVFVPSVRSNSKGVSWENGSTPGTSLSIDQFYIASPGVSASTINTQLSQGKHLIFTPGIYHITSSIQINNANTVVLGIGFPTLVADNGAVAIKVADVDGVKIAGLLFDAGSSNSSSLLQVGPAGSSANHAANPTSLHDLFFRAGGGGVGKVDANLVINSNNVIGDHFWIWRADHGIGVGWTTNVSKNGLVVNGNDVTVYGLFNEHHNEYQTLWNGNGGKVYFYQSEIAYDVPSQAAWMNGSVNGFASYKVANTVTTHEAWGLGIYSFFRDAPVKLNSAIEVPDVQGVKIHHATTIWLSGTAGSEITHIINNLGGTVYANSPSDAMRQTLSEFVGTGTGGGGGTETALDRTGWTATTSPVNSTPEALFDNNMSTRWTSGKNQVPGQSIIMDMKAVKNFNKLVMDSTGNNSDYARGYEIYVSNDGTSWGSPITTGTGSAPIITVSFTAQNARYIKVVQTGVASNWWSIRELNVYTSGSGGSGGGPTGASLDRTSWVATTSPVNGTPEALFDGDMSTRWTSGKAQAPGQSIILDMQAVKTFNKLVMDSTGNNNDYARSYEVYVSNNGTSWGSAVANGTGTAPIITIELSVQNARYIKVVQTGTVSNWWSIREFNVYY